MPVYKDEKRGTWYCSFYYTDWQGVRHKTKKRGFPRKKDAQDYEREFLNKEQSSCDMSFASLVDLYFEDMKTRLRETTIDNKRNIFDTKILPAFQSLAINKIQPSHIRKWQADLISQGFAQTYLKTINNQLSAIFNYAVRYYKLPENPVRLAGSMGRKKADEMDIWTLDEFKRFISAVDKPAVKLAFEIMFWAGLRVGETLALFPRDILLEKMIDINKTTSRKDGIDNFYDPKTTKSFRKVPIPDFLYDEIQDYIGKLYGIKEDEQIFYFAKSTLNKNLDYYANLAGVKRIRVHDLRHSHASLLIEMGQPILLISERLGHETVDTTWNTYAHLYPNKGVALADELQKMKF
ncbi:site-specific integrase [Anaerovorax sp. IOR16]|uniref:site-specific integrase n=1 Tax=Anaerovorax sp. IOR16 TaxID=2773458 RepID=UPI0019CF651F|nr:site-specific integrase [Anaerovorax sp. IOR16]